MDIVDIFNFFAYLAIFFNVAAGDEEYVYLYNRLVIFLRGE